MEQGYLTVKEWTLTGNGWQLTAHLENKGYDMIDSRITDFVTLPESRMEFFTEVNQSVKSVCSVIKINPARDKMVLLVSLIEDEN